MKFSAGSLCALFLILLLGCSDAGQKETGGKFPEELSRYFPRSLDLKKIVGAENWIAGDFRIRNGKVLLQYGRKGAGSDQGLMLSVVDLKTGRREFALPSPITEVWQTFDVQGDTLVSLSTLHPDALYLTTISSGYTARLPIDFGGYVPNQPATIDYKGKLVYGTTDIYGFAVVNVETGNGKGFSDFLLGVLNSTIGYPIRDDINLLAGTRATGMSGPIVLYAMDGAGAVLWNKTVYRDEVIAENGKPAFTILNAAEVFIVAYDRTVVCWNKQDGMQLWQRNFRGAISQLQLTNDRLLVQSLALQGPRTIPLRSDAVVAGSLTMLDPARGTVQWQRSYESHSEAQVCLMAGNKLLLCHDGLLKICAVETGEVLSESKPAAMPYLNVVRDLGNNRNYLESDYIIYW